MHLHALRLSLRRPRQLAKSLDLPRCSRTLRSNRLLERLDELYLLSELDLRLIECALVNDGGCNRGSEPFDLSMGSDEFGGELVLVVLESNGEFSKLPDLVLRRLRRFSAILLSLLQLGDETCSFGLEETDLLTERVPLDLLLSEIRRLRLVQRVELRHIGLESVAEVLASLELLLKLGEGSSRRDGRVLVGEKLGREVGDDVLGRSECRLNAGVEARDLRRDWISDKLEDKARRHSPLRSSLPLWIPPPPTSQSQQCTRVTLVTAERPPT